MNILSIASSAMKNFSVPDSVRAGGGAAVITVAIGSILVALGVSIPVLNVPLTMSMVLGAAVPIGHIVTALMPDSVKQQVDALGKKIGVQVSDLKTMVPQIEASYPAQSSPPTTLTPSNINKNPS